MTNTTKHPLAGNIARSVRSALWLACTAGAAASWGQPTSAPGPAPSASAALVPPPLRSSPLVTSPWDARRSMDLDNAQPEGKVTPQIRIPLGKNAAPPVFERPRPRPSDAGATGPLIDDAAARCEAQKGDQVRAKCRDQLARQAKPSAI